MSGSGGAGAQPDPDQDLLDGVRAGNRRALDDLLRRHQPRLWAVCRRLTGSDADADDAVQEAMVSIVRALPRFDGRSRFGTWAYRIAVNASLDELRRRRRRAEPGLPGDPDLGPDAGGGGAPAGAGGRGAPAGAGGRGAPAGAGGRGAPAGAGGRGEPVATTPGPEGVALAVDVGAALRRLPPEFRAAVVLRDLCGLDYAEIAEVLSLPAGTVRSRISRGRAALAPLLAPTPDVGSSPPTGENRGAGNPTGPAERPTPRP